MEDGLIVLDRVLEADLLRELDFKGVGDPVPVPVPEIAGEGDRQTDPIPTGLIPKTADVANNHPLSLERGP